MRKVSFKIICLVVVLLTAFSGFSGSVFADGEHSIVIDYDSTLGSVEVTTGTAASSVETMAEGIAYDSIWRATKALSANVPVEVMDGITITPFTDFKTSNRKQTFNSIEFSGAIQGSIDSKVTESGVEGVVFKVDVERTGRIYFAMSLNAGKGAIAANVKDIKTHILEYTNDTGDTVNDMNVCSFDVTAGESYYFWPKGTKPYTFGAVFKEKTIVSAQTGDSVTVKSTPSSGNYIGNVRLGDETITLNKNEGMTECTFVMPDSDVELFVDFISKSVNDEVQKVPFSEIKGSNASESAVYENLVLFDGYNVSGAGYADVSWESSNEGVISVSGEVNALSTDTQVDFTAVFTWQDYPNLRLTKTFHLTVPADNDDNAAVEAAKNALTLGDTSAVKKNLELPTSGIRHTQIKWSSSNSAVVSADGKVTPVWEQSTTVTLTAEISRGSASAQKEFTIVVPAQYAITVNRIAVSGKDGYVTVKPMNGGYVSHIIMTDNIANKKDESLLVAVYDKNEALAGAGVIALKDVPAEAQSQNNGDTILYLDKLNMDKIPVFDGCTVKVFAFDNMQNIKPATSQAAYVYNSGITDKPTVYVAGDSTACTYQATGSKNRFPQTGWAAVLGDYFSGATVNDLALSGRSSLDFRTETNYSTIKNGLKAGDYFIIQFGHNDGKENDEKRYTNPKLDRFTQGSYKKNITDNYINVALDKGANPIITTSISRRKEHDAGLEAYVNAAKELGYELGLPVVDLYSKVNGYINEVGEDKAIDLYNFVKPKDSRFVDLKAGEFTKSTFYAAGTTDNTHINYFGAQMISQWFCDELERIGHPLTEKRNSHTTKIEDIPSYADATSK